MIDVWVVGLDIPFTCPIDKSAAMIFVQWHD